MDPIYSYFTRLENIPNEEGEKTMIRVRLTRYRGRTVKLADGTIIKQNDILVKIHLHNVKILKYIQGIDSELRRGLMIYKYVRESLPSIARYIQMHENSNEIKGLIGITTVYKGCERLGFNTKSIHNVYYKLFKILSFLSIQFLSSKTKKWANPMYLFMPKNVLLTKYKRV